jgi:hypothetical protein
VVIPPTYTRRGDGKHHFVACFITRTRVPIGRAVLAAACSKRQQPAALGYQLAAACSTQPLV